jgi:rubredoxin
MSYYWTCPDCGANLDIGERCDCNLEYEEDTSREDDIKKDTHPELQRV